MTEGVWLAARAAAYLLVLQAAGAFIFLALFAAHLPATGTDLVRLTRRGAAAALAACLVQLLLEPAYMAGEAAGIGDPSLWQLALHSRTAAVSALRVAGSAWLYLALLARPPRLRSLGLAGVCLALGSFLVGGHTVTGTPRVLLMPLLGVHVLAVSFWLGSVWLLGRLAQRLEPAPLAALLRSFSAIAMLLVPLLGLAGIALASLLLPDLAALATPYGWLLCMKAALFAALLGLAVLNRQRLTPALGQGSLTAARVLRRSLAAEYVLMVLVLCVTAALSGVYSPTGH